MKRLRQLRLAVREAFAFPSGYVAAALGALFVLLLTVALPNMKLLGFTFGASEFSLGLKLRTAAEVLWNGRLIFAHEGGWVALPLAALFGLNIALVYHYMRDQVRINHAAGASVAGIIVGLLGIGCAACGSVVLTSLLGLGAVSLLPFHGQEFAWLGMAVIVVSTFSIAAKIADPAACKIPKKR
ncbi:MAG TPA: hypothetical protein VL283_02575 [Candidatus Baltobacteraceae bacterium]|nr:hypothetical protein [Candidatus Baltobacteraceae bacterium]